MGINEIRSEYINQYSFINKQPIKAEAPINEIHQYEYKDEYIDSKKSENTSFGLYGLAHDENGNRKIVYDDPRKKDSVASDGIKSAKGNGNPKKCTMSTDSVDREIERLKREKQQIQQQLRSADGNDKKRKELERKLTQVENELSQKDTDSYRRQHAVIKAGN